MIGVIEYWKMREVGFLGWEYCYEVLEIENDAHSFGHIKPIADI